LTAPARLQFRNHLKVPLSKEFPFNLTGSQCCLVCIFGSTNLKAIYQDGKVCSRVTVWFATRSDTRNWIFNWVRLGLEISYLFPEQLFADGQN